MFLPWFYYDWTPAPGVPTGAANYLADARLDPLARDYLQACEPVAQLRERLVATHGALDAGTLRAAFLDLVAVYREGAADLPIEDDEGDGVIALSYAIDKPAAVLDGLRDLLLGNAGLAGDDPFRDVDTDFPMLVLLLRDPAAPDNASPDARVLATVELEPDSLTLLVDSDERADQAAALVAGRLGDRARLLEIAGNDGDDGELDVEELANDPRIVATVLDAMFEVWADTPHEALDGRTPRAEAKSAAGRARVAELLDGLEHEVEAELPGVVEAPASALRRPLGL